MNYVIKIKFKIDHNGGEEKSLSHQLSEIQIDFLDFIVGIYAIGVWILTLANYPYL